MKFTLLAVASFLAIPVLANVPAGALQMNVKRTTHQVSNDNKRIKARAEHDQSVEDKISNQKYYYASTVQIGNPPQEVEVLIDTGSSDTWVISPQTKYSGEDEGPKSFFDPSKSNTWSYNDTEFDIKYGIGHTSGKWGTDSLRIGDAEIKDLSIGVADNTDVKQGIIGVGRPQAEITSKEKREYSNLPQKLYESGKINSPAFSLFLDEASSDSGSILFGAVDHSKYTGNLVSMAVTHPSHYGVQVSGIRADGRASQNILGKPTTAILDSGTTGSYFDENTLRSLYEVLNANPSFAINQKYYTDCNITDHLIFSFGMTEIKVPASNFLTPIEGYVNAAVAGVAFPHNSCYVGVDTATGGDYILLGENMLRAMYIVYDSQNQKVALAQANFDKRSPEIELIQDNVIPRAIS